MIGIQGGNGRCHGKHGNKQVFGQFDVIKQEIRQPLLNRLEHAQRGGGMRQVLLIDGVLLLAQLQVTLQGLANRRRVGGRTEQIVRIRFVGLHPPGHLGIYIHFQLAGRFSGIRVQQVVVRPGLFTHPEQPRMQGIAHTQ